MTEALLHGVFAFGGGLGAVARHLLTLRIVHDLPLATVVVNVLGCFVLGFGVATLEDLPGLLGDEQRRLVTGFCGGFTTFSAFAYQTLDLHRTHTLAHAAGNILLSLLLCLLAFGGGRACGLMLTGQG